MNQRIILDSLCYITKSFENISRCSIWLYQELITRNASDLKLKRALKLEDIKIVKILFKQLNESNAMFHNDTKLINRMILLRNDDLIEFMIKHKVHIDISGYFNGGRGPERGLLAMLINKQYPFTEEQINEICSRSGTSIDYNSEYWCLIL